MSGQATHPGEPGIRGARWPLRNALLGAGFFVGYVLLDWLSYIHPMQQYSITPWNPQPALAIGLLMLFGQRWLPLVILAAIAAEWLVRGAPGGWLSTLVIGAVLGLAYAAIARALTGRFAVHSILDSRRDALRLVAVVSLGTLGAGVLYIAALLASGVGPLDRPFTALVRFWIGDAVGILVTLPVVLLLSRADRRAELRQMLTRGEMLLYGGVTLVACAIVFLSPASEQVKLFYVLFLPLILVATRYGMAGASISAVVIQGAVIATGEIVGYETLTVFEFQALLIALTVTGLFLGVTVDERRRIEAELRRTLRLAAAGEMAAALAHELNQPLTALATYARASEVIASAQDVDRGLLRQTLSKLVAECTRAGEVVRRLRDFFRSGSTTLAQASLDAIVARAVASVEPTAQASEVALHVDAGGAMPDVLADTTQLDIVMRNLLTNAISAAATSPKVRQVRVQTTLDARGWPLVSVYDSGSGVADVDAERIFEPFETSRASGMGMGLAISRALVEAHGGRLWVEPGDHGLFRFTLPVALGAHE